MNVNCPVCGGGGKLSGYFAAPCPDCAAKDIVITAIGDVLRAAGYDLPLQEQVGACIQERDTLRAELKLMEHKVITCGVAASNPDPDLTTTKKCYAETWNSPQADAVRALRKERDALRAEVERLRAELSGYEIAAAQVRQMQEQEDQLRAMGGDAAQVPPSDGSTVIDEHFTMTQEQWDKVRPILKQVPPSDAAKEGTKP